jgi:hypothetical protein
MVGVGGIGPQKVMEVLGGKGAMIETVLKVNESYPQLHGKLESYVLVANVI